MLPLSLVIAALTSVAPLAQDLSASPVACEIHVWPATAFHTLTEGAVWNNVLDSGFVTRPGHAPERQVPPHGPLDVAGQRALLDALDFPTLLHNSGAAVVLHEDASARRATGIATGRQTHSTSPCYMEMTVAKNFFNRSGLTDRTLRTLFILDDFRDQPMPQKSFVAWGATVLSIFPAKQPDQAAAADAELAAAFQTNVRKFSGYAFAEPRKK